MQHKLDALLVFPPFVSAVVDSVYPSVYFLANYLRQSGFQSDWWDMNRDSLSLVIERCVIDAEITRLSSIRRDYEEHGHLSPAEASDYHRTVAYEAWLSLTRRNRGMLINEHNPMDLCTGPLTLGSMLTPLVDRYFAFAESNKTIPRASELPDVLDSERAHRFSSLVREAVHARIRNDSPLLVGISIPFSTQFITALLLAREIKAASPETHVCLGGPIITLLSCEFTDQCIAMQIIDSVVLHEGEKPLAHLVSNLRDSRQPGRIPEMPDGVTKDTSESLLSGCRARLTASHTRLSPLPAHLREGGVPVPVLQSTGCYWGKCTFCDYVNLYCNSGYRYRPVHAVVDDMEYYAAAGVSHFRLIAEAVPPRHAAEIAHEILRRRLRVTWHSYLRVDRQFHVSTLIAMKESGYRYATLGLESSEDRLLRILNKGYVADDVRHFFENCQEARFSFGQVNIIYDIPTTTYKEALGVLEFCKSYKDIAPRIQLFQFQLTSTSSMASDPDKYGILIGGPDAVQQGTFLTTAIPFADPHGMNNNEKAKIRALYQEHDAEITDDHAYGGHMRTILKARRLSDLDAYTFCFLDEKCFHETETRITAHDSAIRPRKLLYCRDSHEVFEISDDAMILLRAVSGKELSIHDLSALIRTACPFVADESIVLEFVKLCAAARLIKWCAHRNGQRMYAAPEFLPEWRRLLDNSDP